MCGIGGVARRDSKGVSRETLMRMAAVLRHRGPDGVGIAPGPRVGLAHTRLSIIDIARGAQPLTNEDGNVIITYNGEVYNYRELRVELERKGHQFRTHTDTEVLVHAYEQWGPAMLSRLNGQFAFAIYDRRTESVFLARDRFGVRPLFYTMHDGDLIFGSEIKALLATGEVPAAFSPHGLDEVFTFWAARAPRTPFENVFSLEPGCFAVWRSGSLKITRYYALNFPEASDEPHGALLTLDELMRSGVSLRMRADVPVGGYLSGGLDSSITCALAAPSSPYALRTFSVTFDDPALDESAFQRLVARDVGSEHEVAHIRALDIARVFPDVIKHTETPLVRSASAPMFLLSRLTREHGIKVVLTGEGADELFMGYDIFKETAVRLFCERQPASKLRPRLFDRLYPYLGGARGGDFWRRSFLHAGATGDPLYSHIPRFMLTSRIKDFYSSEMRMSLVGADAQAELRASLPSDFHGWSAANRAVYLEMVTLLPSYLLSSQGDRMGMAHGVEARFPFLDHRLFEFAAALPTKSKLRGLREKDILRRWANDIVPQAVTQRGKQPYRAPDAPAFFGHSATPYVDELLDDTAIQRTGIFDARAVKGLVRRCRAGQVVGFAENQALIAVLSTQLWCEQFLNASVVSKDAAYAFSPVAGVPAGSGFSADHPTMVEQLC